MLATTGYPYRSTLVKNQSPIIHLLGLVHLYLVVVMPAQVRQKTAHGAPRLYLSDKEKEVLRVTSVRLSSDTYNKKYLFSTMFSSVCGLSREIIASRCITCVPVRRRQEVDACLKQLLDR